MARVDLGWADGKRRRKTLYGRTRRKVSDALSKALRAAQEGTLLTDERQTVGQFLARWLSDVAKPRVRPRTLDTYEAAITHHILPTLAKRPLAKLTPQDCQAWIATLAEQGVALGRIRYARVVLRNALNTAIRWRVVSSNVDPLRLVVREIRPLTPEEAKQLLKTAANGALEGFVGIALGCGLRLGEALGLQWADVDLEAGTLRVHQQLQRSGGDTLARRPLLTERTKLRKLLRAEEGDEQRLALQKALREVRGELRTLKTTVQLVEPKSGGASAQSLCPLSPFQLFGVIGYDSLRRDSPPARSGRTKGLCSRRLSGRRWTPATSASISSGCSRPQGSQPSVSTTCDTPARRCSLLRASMPEQSWRRWGTRKWVWRWTPTAMYCPLSSERQLRNSMRLYVEPGGPSGNGALHVIPAAIRIALKII
jgi:integrase